MNDAIARMLHRYECQSVEDHVRALREIMQEIALRGLWRSKFFEKAAFYGGTALRILYGMDRFSEDLDFSLLRPTTDFELSRYSAAVERELRSFGFEARMTTREKKEESPVQSAFLKANTLKHLLTIKRDEKADWPIPREQMLKIKVEVDTDPPPGFSTENKFILQPIPFSVRTFVLPDLFAEKNARRPLPTMEEPCQGPRLVRSGLVFRKPSATSPESPGSKDDPERAPEGRRKDDL